MSSAAQSLDGGPSGGDPAFFPVAANTADGISLSTRNPAPPGEPPSIPFDQAPVGREAQRPSRLAPPRVQRKRISTLSRCCCRSARRTMFSRRPCMASRGAPMNRERGSVALRGGTEASWCGPVATTMFAVGDASTRIDYPSATSDVEISAAFARSFSTISVNCRSAAVNAIELPLDAVPYRVEGMACRRSVC